MYFFPSKISPKPRNFIHIYVILMTSGKNIRSIHFYLFLLTANNQSPEVSVAKRTESELVK